MVSFTPLPTNRSVLPPMVRCITVFVIVVTDVHMDLDRVKREGQKLRAYLDDAGYPLPTMVLSSTEEVSEQALLYLQKGLGYSFFDECVFCDPWFDMIHAFGWRSIAQRFCTSFLFKRWLAFAYGRDVDHVVFFCHHDLFLRLIRDTIIEKGWWMRYMDGVPGGVVGVLQRLRSANSGELVTVDFEFDPSTSTMAIESITYLSGAKQKYY